MRELIFTQAAVATLSPSARQALRMLFAPSTSPRPSWRMKSPTRCR
jgi:hypothetical protein